MSWYCGWDGGGTKTLVCVQDAAGNTLTEAEFGPLNPNGASPDTVRETVRRSVDFMAMQPDGLAGCKGLVIGFAGVSSSHAVSFIEDAVRQCSYAGPLRLLGDQEIALTGPALQGRSPDRTRILSPPTNHPLAIRRFP